MGTTYKQDRLIDRYSDNGLFIVLKIASGDGVGRVNSLFGGWGGGGGS